MAGFQPNREQLAWAAGFFDGEGSFCLGNASSSVLVSIGQAGTEENAPDTLTRFHAAVGGIGKISGPTHYGPSAKSMWRYRCDRFEQSQAVGAMLWQWLSGAKREKFLHVLRTHHARTLKPLSHKGGRIHWTHCPRGHEFTPENTLRTKKNTRLCKACHDWRKSKDYVPTHSKKGD